MATPKTPVREPKKAAPKPKIIRKQIKIGSGPTALRDSATFTSMREANEWYIRRKAELMARKSGTEGDFKTLRDAIEKYTQEIAPKHRGESWEVVRLQAMMKHKLLPVNSPINAITNKDMSKWVQWRTSIVKNATVLRELSLLGGVLSATRKDWHWTDHNPLSDLRKPPSPAPLDRTITRQEIKGMLRALNYEWGRPPKQSKQMVAYIFLLALRTGMRCGEIAGLEWCRVQPSWADLPMTKNGTARQVPLGKKARRLIACLRAGRDEDQEKVFNISSGSIDTTFRKAREAAGLSGFTFHASRHTAATWIGRHVGQPGRLSFPQFCALFGWRDPKNAMIYVNPKANELAELL